MILRDELTQLAGVGERDYRTVAAVLTLAQTDIELQVPWSIETLRDRLAAAFETDYVRFSDLTKSAALGALRNRTNLTSDLCKNLEAIFAFEQQQAGAVAGTHLIRT